MGFRSLWLWSSNMAVLQHVNLASGIHNYIYSEKNNELARERRGFWNIDCKRDLSSELHTQKKNPRVGQRLKMHQKE